MTEKRFKECLIEFDNTVDKLNKEKRIFVFDVKEFMLEYNIPVRVLFFGDTFGLDIDLNIRNWQDVPRKIPLSVLSEFCKKFGCEFEYTNCDGKRYIFSFDGLNMRY